jgi:hypothetical protein
MDIITKLNILFKTNLEAIDNDEYFELVNELGYSVESQKKFIDYILYNTLSIENKSKVFMLLREVYGLETEENYNLNLMELYNWVLNLMFKERFYNYSICYKFSDLLVMMSKNVEQVYRDIINMIDINKPISVQIAICSMYGVHKFYNYKELTEIFFDKILLSIERNENNKNIIEDINNFLRGFLKLKEYEKYKEKFSSYLGKG